MQVSSIMKKFAAIGSAVALCVSSPAWAASACQGVVTQVYIEPNGDTYMTWGGWNTKLCNPSQTWSVDRGSAYGGVTNITKEVCQSLTAMLMTAKAQGKPVIIYVDKTSCGFSGGIETPYPYLFYFPQ